MICLVLLIQSYTVIIKAYAGGGGVIQPPLNRHKNTSGWAKASSMQIIGPHSYRLTPQHAQTMLVRLTQILFSNYPPPTMAKKYLPPNINFKAIYIRMRVFWRYF